MPALVVGGVTIPVTPGGIARDRLDMADRSRAFDGTYRGSVTGNPKRDWSFSTPPVTRVYADFYEQVLSHIEALSCSGDIIGGGSNLLPYSEDFSTWADTGVTVSPGQSDPTGGSSASQLSDSVGANARVSDVTFTANGTKVVSIHGKYINFADSRVGLRDDTAATFRHRINIAWNAGATPTVTTVDGAGTIYPVQDLSNGWYRFSFSANSVVAANTNKIYVYPAVVGVGSARFYGAQAENASVATAYTRTTGTPVNALSVNCCPEITGWTPVRIASGHYVVLSFSLHEA